MNNTPIDEYYFWKTLIENKQEAYEIVPDKMFELLAISEIKMTHYLAEKHHLSRTTVTSVYQH
ncbi:MAG: hypothetical protein KZQ83_04015 [gamma proteobacterium symbiont of Taylorina sp.]|nr:hypothetical protein [gamma proteobacterium symbiont of Taylorina sp.]